MLCLRCLENKSKCVTLQSEKEGGGGYFSEFFGGVVRLGSPKSDRNSDQNMQFSERTFQPWPPNFVYPFSYLVFVKFIPVSVKSIRVFKLFKTKMVEIYTLFQIKTGRNHILWPCTYLYRLYRGVPLSPVDKEST